MRIVSNISSNPLPASVQYDVEYKHQHRNAGFNVQEMMSEENQVQASI